MQFLQLWLLSKLRFVFIPKIVRIVVKQVVALPPWKGVQRRSQKRKHLRDTCSLDQPREDDFNMKINNDSCDSLNEQEENTCDWFKHW